MLQKTKRDHYTIFLLLIGLALLSVSPLNASIPGISGPSFTFTAKEGYISTPDGNSIYMWGYANGNGPTAVMQYPGPTMILQEGEAVQVVLYNELTVPVSILFPGQQDQLSKGGSQGLITREALPGEMVIYHFTANNPGTYTYFSGTHPDLQIEMGLFGAIIVRPNMGDSYAYNHPDTYFDHEYLFLLSEIDPVIHENVEYGAESEIDNTTYWPVNWFINGRAAPDTMVPANSPLLPHQPYNCMPRMHPGEKMLMRLIGGGRDRHPFHHHGNNATIYAIDGRLLESSPGAGPDLAYSDFTIPVTPGGTVDAIFEWTGYKLGWDIYGHAPDDPLEANEYEPDHGKPFPVVLPEHQDLTFGPHYSGSPYLSQFETLPPNQGGMNLFGGFYFMWHSHNEKEMVNNDIFPGGMMTMCIIEPNDVFIQ